MQRHKLMQTKKSKPHRPHKCWPFSPSHIRSMYTKKWWHCRSVWMVQRHKNPHAHASKRLDPHLQVQREISLRATLLSGGVGCGLEASPASHHRHDDNKKQQQLQPLAPEGHPLFPKWLLSFGRSSFRNATRQLRQGMKMTMGITTSMPRCRSAPRSCRSLHHPAQPCHQTRALIYSDYQRRSSTWVLTSVHRRLWMMLTSPWSPLVLRCSVPPNSTRTSCSSCSHPQPPPAAAPAAGHRHPSRLALPVSQAARTQALHAYASCLPPLAASRRKATTTTPAPASHAASTQPLILLSRMSSCWVGVKVVA